MKYRPSLKPRRLMLESPANNGFFEFEMRFANVNYIGGAVNSCPSGIADKKITFERRFWCNFEYSLSLIHPRLAVN